MLKLNLTSDYRASLSAHVEPDTKPLGGSSIGCDMGFPTGHLG